METLRSINQEDGITVVVSLHQVDYAYRYCPRTIALRDGQIIYDGPSDALTPAFLHELYGAESDELILGEGREKVKPMWKLKEGMQSDYAVRHQRVKIPASA